MFFSFFRSFPIQRIPCTTSGSVNPFSTVKFNSNRLGSRVRQQVQQTGVVAGLAGNLTGLVVTLGDGGDEGTTIGGAQQQGNIGLGGTGDHVLDEVTVTGGIDDGVVPLLREELLRRAPQLRNFATT